MGLFQCYLNDIDKKISLSVQKENYAVNMYRKIGFKVVSETEEEYIMVCELQ